MDFDGVKSPTARRILVHWADERPAWLWTAEGVLPLWRNSAATYFNAKAKKSGPKLSPLPVPIKGQIARLIRLGSPGRSSLARIRFIAGDRPVSSTCTVTPLELPGEPMAVLLVAVDPIEPEFSRLLQFADPMAESLLPAGARYALFDPAGLPVAQSATLEGPVVIAQDGNALAHAGTDLPAARFKASPAGHQLLLAEAAAATTIDAVRAEEGIFARSEPAEPPAPVEADAPASESTDKPDVPSLSSLFDRLADTENLFGELSEADDTFVAPAAAEPAAEPEPPATESAAPPAEPSEDMIGALIAFDADLSEDTEAPVTYRVTGRGFTPLETAAPVAAAPALEPDGAGAAVTAPEPAVPPALPASPGDAEAVERASRYNFDELSRILADRVGAEASTPEPPAPVKPPAPAAPPPAPTPPLRLVQPTSESALVNIAAETFILNRLPLAILVFRDQQVLFANRALTDLVGFETVASLRHAGIAAIFPGDDAVAAGPVTDLVRRDGTRVPVTARLQSITWQGRPALMLSASAAETRLGHEAAVRGFAEMLAGLRDEGLILTDRSGKTVLMSARALLALGREDDGTGVPLAELVEPDELPRLREFLERPARFAETARPSLSIAGAAPGTELLLFVEGQAGIVSGYFGFVRQRAATIAAAPASPGEADEDTDPSMLLRVSRGIRRPLNSIIGFADLLRSAAFSGGENHRYLEYARDIKSAGQEIAVLVDELDDYSRLRAGTYAARPANLDLAALLESCAMRVRGQAAEARVLVRSAISERLPPIRADRPSLGQAVLNLLASAIDQTPAGGSAILSAQVEDDGSILINIRDGAALSNDPGEHFVVFRDGVGKDGEALAPVRSSVGMALTRALVAVNSCTLSVDQTGGAGTLFSLLIPPELVAAAQIA